MFASNERICRTVIFTSLIKKLGVSACGLMAALLLSFHAPDAFALACTSAAGVNNWNTIGTWSCARVPTAADSVTIAATSTTTLDTNSAAITSLTVSGTLTIGSNTTARSLTVAGATTVAGTMQVNNPGAATTHTVSLSGNLAVAGTFNMSTANGKGNVTFNGAANQTVSGAGTFTFNLITLNNTGAAANNIVDFQSAMTVPTPFLTLTRGIYKHSNTTNITPWNANPNIPANAGFWLNSTATVSTGAFGVTLNSGSLQIDNGTMNIGTLKTHNLTLNNNAATSFVMNGGVLTVTGGLLTSNAGAAGTFTQNGGAITVVTVAAPSQLSFRIGTAVTFTATGGTLTLQNVTTGANDFDMRPAAPTLNNTNGGWTVQMGNGSTVTGGTFVLTNSAGGSLSLWNLVLNTTLSPTTQLAVTTNILNNLTIQSGATLDANGNNINIGGGNVSGAWTNNGTFTDSTGGPNTVTFTGTGAQTLGGTAASPFVNLTITKSANDVTMGAATPSPTVSGTLTLTAAAGAGKLIMASCAANPISLTTTGITAGGSATSYVQGPIVKNFAAAGSFAFSGAAAEFPVGTSSGYSPIDVTAGTTSTAGSVTVCATATDHPQVQNPPVGGGTIDPSNDVNRYWSMIASGINVTAAPLTATFNFIAGDVDGTATTSAFIVERWDGSVWHGTSLVSAAATSTQAANIVLQGTGTNDFAVGDTFSGFTQVPGRFNAFETSTPSPEIVGNIYTKVVGTPFSLDIVSINAAKTLYNGAVAAVTVQLLDSRDNTGALDVNGCRSTWTVVQTLTAPTMNIPASGRATLGPVTVAQAYRDARLRISSAGPLIGCSTDRFSIRPTGFSSITSTNANNFNSSGGTPVKTGANFNLSAATGLTGYDNGSGNTLANPQLIPLIDNTQIVGSPTAGAIGGTFGAASGGTATGASFYYSEVGNFGLNNNLATTATNAAIYDNVFTAVDKASSDCVAGSFSNTLTGGKYGCNFGNSVIAQTTGSSGFGRFIPDNFNVTFNSPTFATACSAGTFTYVGQTFSFGTAPVMTVTARSGTNNGLTNTTTNNYQGAYMNLSNVACTSPATCLNKAPYNTQAGRYTRFDALGGGLTPALDPSLLPATTADPTISTFTNGVGTLTFSSGTGLAFTRSTTTPSAPFNADIALALNVIDTDGVAYGSNPASFGAATSGNGIAFSNGKPMRFGRLRMYGATGVLNLTLPLLVQTEYWTGTGFTLNSLDSCTTLASSNIALGTYTAPLAACATFVNSTPITISSGTGLIMLAAPGTGNSGSVLATPQLGSTAAGSYCTAVGGAGLQASATAAGKSYLQGAWNGIATYDQNPTGRAAFGVYGAQPRNYIFMRENY